MKTIALSSMLFLALTALPRPAFAHEITCGECFDCDPAWLRGGGGAGCMIVTNGQAVLQHTRMARTDPEAIDGWWTSFAPWWGNDNTNNWKVNFQPGTTVELRADLLQLTQNDTFAGMGVSTLDNDAYVLLLEKNEITLMKTGAGVLNYFTSFFFWKPALALPHTNLTVSAAFTQIDSDLQIHVRILDPAQAVVWEIKVTDTSKLDKVLGNRSIRGLLMEPEAIPGPYVGIDLLPFIGISYLNTTKAPTNNLEVTFDNFQVLTHETPVLSASPSLLLAWQEDTFEEQIAVATDTLTNTVWTPCPLPVLKSDGRFCVTAPTTAKQQFFKLVPGVQFADDFSPAKAPFSARLPYQLTWSVPGDSVTVTNGVMQILCQGSLDDGFTIEPSSTSIEAADFYTSVDILNWMTSTNNGSVIGLVGRAEYYSADSGNGVIGFLTLNQSKIMGKVQLQIWDGSTTTSGASFIYQPGTPYRLQFSGVGTRLLLRVLNLQTKEVVKEMKLNSNTLQKGLVGIWAGSPNTVRGTHEIILDNFFVTGTKPVMN